MGFKQDKAGKKNPLSLLRAFRWSCLSDFRMYARLSKWRTQHFPRYAGGSLSDFIHPKLGSFAVLDGSIDTLKKDVQVRADELNRHQACSLFTTYNTCRLLASVFRLEVGFIYIINSLGLDLVQSKGLHENSYLQISNIGNGATAYICSWRYFELIFWVTGF